MDPSPKIRTLARSGTHTRKMAAIGPIMTAIKGAGILTRARNCAPARSAHRMVDNRQQILGRLHLGLVHHGGGDCLFYHQYYGSLGSFR